MAPPHPNNEQVIWRHGLVAKTQTLVLATEQDFPLPHTISEHGKAPHRRDPRQITPTRT
jgi:hypothetical protein